MSVRITEESMTTSTFTLTDEQVAHACHHFTEVLKEKPELAAAETHEDVFHLARGMALCLGHAVDGDEGTNWADKNFTELNLESHLVVIGLVSTCMTAAEYPLPEVLELVGVALSRVVEVIDDDEEANRAEA